MADKKSSKSNKTAHVLNLITNSPHEGEASPSLEPITHGEGGEQPAVVQNAPANGEGHHLVPPILEVVRNNDEMLSEKVRSALEEELEESAPAEPVSSVEPEESISPPTTVEGASTSAERPERQADSIRDLPDNLVYVNVMQALVEENAPRYMKLFDLCTCSRCVADVKALALSTLPAQYVVMHKGDEIPLLTVYQGRYSSIVTAHVMKACKTVMENPRHGQ